jgi:glycosyltransferase involved in cell wall biosynthesis
MNDRKQLRLCFILFRAYPVFNRDTNQAFGGSEVELYNLAAYFSQFDFIKVDFLVGDYGQKAVETYRNITVRKVRYMREDVYKSPWQKALRYLCFFRAMLRQRSHIYITKTASEHLGWMVLFLKFLKGKKVVFRLGSDKDAEFEFWKSSRRLYRLYRFGLRNSDLIYVQSEDQKRMLRENCGLESRVLKNFFPAKKEKSLPHKEYILWVSRCEPLKRPELFLQLARSLPDEKFVMIMPHIRSTEDLENTYEKEMTGTARKASEELENFEYYEFIPFQEIQRFYNHAKLFVNTSEYEGFPNSFIQSCLGRTGILTFRVNPDGILDRYGLGYCCGDDPDRAVEFIRELEGRQIRKMGENAYDYVKQNHDPSRIGKAYLGDFMRLTGWNTEKGCFSR